MLCSVSVTVVVELSLPQRRRRRRLAVTAAGLSNCWSIDQPRPLINCTSSSLPLSLCLGLTQGQIDDFTAALQLSWRETEANGFCATLSAAAAERLR